MITQQVKEFVYATCYCHFLAGINVAGFNTVFERQYRNHLDFFNSRDDTWKKYHKMRSLKNGYFNNLAYIMSEIHNYGEHHPNPELTREEARELLRIIFNNRNAHKYIDRVLFTFIWSVNRK